MGNSDMIHDKWRRAARAEAHADDRFTVIWNAMVDAYVNAGGSGQYYLGMLNAYSLLTGDPVEVVHVQVMKAAGRPADEVAATASVAQRARILIGS